MSGQTRLKQAEKALLTAMGEKPSRLVSGSVEVLGRSVAWEERCNGSKKRGGGESCLHARYGSADHAAIEAFFEATEEAA